jgi:hypothetical protein
MYTFYYIFILCKYTIDIHNVGTGNNANMAKPGCCPIEISTWNIVINNTHVTMENDRYNKIKV